MRYLVSLLLSLLALPLAAQSQRPSHCIAIADAAPGIEFIQKASFRDPLDPFNVRISYIDHSMFLIQAASGPTAVTDYNGFIGVVDFVPDVVTMNNAHNTHWTALPDPAIPHVLEGWWQDGAPASHRLEVGEMLVRNVTTDTRPGAFAFGSQEVNPDANSIFVFEVEGLCIGHMGHLHHVPDDAQYAALGRLDVVMVPVDGGFTLSTEEVRDMLGRLRSSLVLPMHWFSEANLDRFLEEMAGNFVIRRTLENSVSVSLRDLPSQPTIVVLRPQFLRNPR
ncbi:MAG: MBL fold metallo-hydrolase [Pseudomonadota bacterium]